MPKSKFSLGSLLIWRCTVRSSRYGVICNSEPASSSFCWKFLHSNT